jgi:MFS family permease
VLRRYRSVLSLPDARPLVLAGTAAQLPKGMLGLAIVLLLRHTTGSFGAAAAGSAAYVVGLSASAPARGRLADRAGGARSLGLLLWAQVGCIGFLLATALAGAPLALSVLAAALIGVTQPPVNAALRSAWGELLRDDDRLETAMALDMSATETMFVLGPAIVALLATALGTWAPLVVALLAQLLAVPVLANRPVLRTVQEPDEQRPREAWFSLRAIRSGAMVALLLMAMIVSILYGCLDIALPALASVHGSAAAAGYLLTAFAAASFVGGLVSGGRDWAGSAARRHLIMLALITLVLAPLPLISTLPLAAIPLIPAGLFAGAMTVQGWVLITDGAPRGRVGEATSWLSSAGQLGVAAGAGLAGALVGPHGLHAALAVAPAAALVATVIAVATLRLLDAPVAPVASPDARADLPPVAE